MLGMAGRERNKVNCVLVGGWVSSVAVILKAEIYSISFWFGVNSNRVPWALKRIWDFNGVASQGRVGNVV